MVYLSSGWVCAVIAITCLVLGIMFYMSLRILKIVLDIIRNLWYNERKKE